MKPSSALSRKSSSASATSAKKVFRLMERAVARTKQIVEGNPLDATTMTGAQASNDQFEKILSYLDIGRKEGAKILTGGERRVHPGELKDGCYVQPTIFVRPSRPRTSLNSRPAAAPSSRRSVANAGRIDALARTSSASSTRRPAAAARASMRGV